MKRYGHLFYRYLLAGKDDRDDIRRRETILNIILFLLTLAGSIGFAAALILGRFGDTIHHGNSCLDIALLTIVPLVLWRLARSYHPTMAAMLLLACLGSGSALVAFRWSFELPSVQLAGAALLVIAGLTLSAPRALLITCLLPACVLILAYFQINHILTPDASWLNEPLEFSNAVDFALILTVIGLVTWLANLEIDHSMQRVQESEQALLAERDNLEIRIAERTQLMEQAQLARQLELQRFAEFGRLSAHLIHEVANPLTAASLNLQLLGKEHSETLRQVRRNIQQLERYVHAARNHLRAQSQQKTFALSREIRQTMAVVKPIAQRANVHLEIQPFDGKLKLFGDPVKFNQIIANILVNAIDAYADLDPSPTSVRSVHLNHTVRGRNLQIRIKDYGKGIAKEQLPLLFEPFYTTKGDSVRGLGMGLSLVKQTVEQDFHGSVHVSSNQLRGTEFTVTLQLQALPEHQRAKEKHAGQTNLSSQATAIGTVA